MRRSRGPIRLPQEHEQRWLPNAWRPSEIGFQVDPGAVVGDGRGRRAGVEKQPRRQELRRGGQVGGDLLLEDLVDHTDPYRTATRRRRHAQGQDTTRCDAEACVYLSVTVGEPVPKQLTAACSARDVARAAVDP